MAVSTTPPLLTPLPPAPLPTDAESVFDAKAGASLTAQAAMVAEVNASLTWQAGATADTKGYKEAAATSAGNAANSAILAGQQVGLAADQVALATTQASNASASANSAQASAQAAGSAAGFPAFVDGLDILQVRPDKTGVQWGKVGQAIGDVLETARTPDATYLLPDTIYSRAAYPALFTIVGTQGEKNDASGFISASTGMAGTITGVALGKNGLCIAVGYNVSPGATSAIAAKSLDGGKTWASLPALTGVLSHDGIYTDKNGVWIVISSAMANAAYRSVDDGVTWKQMLNIPSAYPREGLK